MKRCGSRKVLLLGCGLFALVMPSSLLGVTSSAVPDAAGDLRNLASPANVEQYFRDRFEIPESTNVSAQPVQKANAPHFYQTVVTVNDGKQTRAFNAFITDDARCFAIGSVFPLSGASEADIILCVREAASLPAAAKVTVGTFTRTRLPGFLRSKVTVELGTKSQQGDLFVTEDRRTGVLGLVLPYRRDLVEQLIDTKGQPSIGSAHAPVTIVEYADLECPRCAMVQKFLESEFLPKYGSRVRLIYKEFPLSFHTWSTSAAVANECAYQIEPSAFFSYRSMIFGSQDTITAGNVRDRMLALGEEAGLNRVRLAACFDAKASAGRIEASRRETEALGVAGTPTFVINGRLVVNMASPAAFYRMVDEALAAGK